MGFPLGEGIGMQHAEFLERERDRAALAGYEAGERGKHCADPFTGADVAILLNGMRTEEEQHLVRLRALLSGLEGSRPG
jgi:hypothetical protein